MATPGVQVLEVLLHDRLVGTLTRLPDDRTLFAFDSTYEADPNRPVLSLSFKTVDGVRAPTRASHVKVPSFFSNLLPEGHLREYLAKRGSINPEREFFLLWLLGQDLPGATVITPADGHELPPTTESAERSSTQAPAVLRFSLAGTQMKFSAVMGRDGGLTIPATGIGGSWIIKLPSPRYASVPEVEYAMLELAKASGIDTPEIQLVGVSEIENLPAGVSDLGDTALVLKRFDRGDSGQRIHMEDFAQVFGLYPHEKYDDASYDMVARTLWAEAGPDSVMQFARRLAFSVLIGNADMHLKNWTVQYPDRRTARLSPAYDLVPTVAYIPGDTRLALSLGGEKQMASISAEVFRRFAVRAGVPQSEIVDAATDTAERLRLHWKRNEVVDMLPDRVRESLSAHMASMPLAR